MLKFVAGRDEIQYIYVMPELMKTPVLSLAVLVLLLPLSLHADIADADSAYERGDYKTALSEYTKLARTGDSGAQYNLAFMYYGGEGVTQDYGQAIYWFEIAAKAGYARAQDILGYMYSHGYGVGADRVRAYVWYSLAAANGIYLDEQVKNTLAAEMGRAERTEADLLAREYARRYLPAAPGAE